MLLHWLQISTPLITSRHAFLSTKYSWICSMLLNHFRSSILAFINLPTYSSGSNKHVQTPIYSQIKSRTHLFKHMFFHLQKVNKISNAHVYVGTHRYLGHLSTFHKTFMLQQHEHLMKILLK